MIVKDVQAGDEYCNVTLVTEHTMPPYPDSKTTTVLNTKQTISVAALQTHLGDDCSLSEVLEDIK